jgi:hypothetical protein
MVDPIGPFLSSLAGKRIPGGCSDCEAEQRLDEVVPNCWSLVIAHDDDCPVLRSSTAGLN